MALTYTSCTQTETKRGIVMFTSGDNGFDNIKIVQDDFVLLQEIKLKEKQAIFFDKQP